MYGGYYYNPEANRRCFECLCNTSKKENLLTGSEVTILTTVNAKVELYIAKVELYIAKVELYIVKGKSGLNNCERELKKDVELSAMFTLTNHTYTANLSISSTHDFYFIYARSQKSQQEGISFAHIHIRLSLKRTRYDLLNAKNDCTLSTIHDNTACTIDLPYRSSQNILLSYNTSSSARNIDVITSCIPRTWVYIVFFLVVPLAIGSLLTAIIILLCKDNKKQ